MTICDLSTQAYVKLCQRVVKYCIRYYDKHVELPTVRTVARAMGLTQADVVTIAEDTDMNIGVAVGIIGYGYSPLPKGDWTLEVFKDVYNG